MKGQTVSLRPLQLFLGGQGGNPGVYEVASELDTGNLVCTCPGFRGRKTCKHSRYVKAQIEKGNGEYRMDFKQGAPEVDLNSLSEHELRSFLAEYGWILQY